MERHPTYPESRHPTSSGSMALRRAVEGWLADGRAQGWSQRTLTDHRQNLERFCWWLENEAETPATLEALTAFNVRTFLGYLRDPHPTGRFGSDNPLAKRPARPSTLAAYHRDLKAFTRFLIAEDILKDDPLKNVRTPKNPNDQIVPMTGEQIQALLDAARRGRNPDRDTALILLLVDSGLRASEVCSLKIGDVDRATGEIIVLSGKGGKARRAYLGATARRSLWKYIEMKRRDAAADEPLFVSTSGYTPNCAFTRSGVTQIVSDLGKASGISGVRCSPHTLRHTFAIGYLRAGGNVLELQRLLGHEALDMTRRYVALAEADLALSHRAASPADRMKLR